jgi:hypothetical protein
MRAAGMPRPVPMTVVKDIERIGRFSGAEETGGEQ